jgi:hypothetical protein
MHPLTPGCGNARVGRPHFTGTRWRWRLLLRWPDALKPAGARADIEAAFHRGLAAAAPYVVLPSVSCVDGDGGDDDSRGNHGFP